MSQKIAEILDLERFPLDRLESAAGIDLLEWCRRELDLHGMFNLDGLVRQAALAQAVAEVVPVLDAAAFTHRRYHNVYFEKQIDGLPADHPALAEVETVNHTICADQIPGSLLCQVYEWPPLAKFLAAALDKETLYTMKDPLARANVMAYHAGEALNWHFDRSEFTTTLLLQAPEAGGQFEYRCDLRTAEDPNYQGVARLLRGEDDAVRRLDVVPGTLNVFRGKNTMHRVSPVEGAQDRIIAVLSYYERPGVNFSDEERLGFYGRVA